MNSKLEIIENVHQNQNKSMENEIISHTTYQCSLCKLDREKIKFDTNSNLLETRSSFPDEEYQLYTIYENIFGICCPIAENRHKIQHEIIYSALSKITQCFKNAKIKMYCLTEMCPETLKLCDTTANFYINMLKPPRLKSILIFCESLFDWLAKSNENRVLICCQGSAPIIVLMIYAYSCFYDALPRRDMRLSTALKIFITKNNKHLEKIPISYRRYGSYMSLYSCMNQLQSLRSSVYLYCLILYSFPSMETDSENSSQLFFKFYTNDPLTCVHTTKLYSLQASVSRLVILFDNIPISLHNDSMILCYHRSPSATRRIRLFRLNFHACQAVSDVLTFHCQDFEDVYQACPMKMKLDLYFRETAVFGQGESDMFVETSRSDLSSIERTDSYSFLENDENSNKMASSIVIKRKPDNTYKSIENTVSSDKSQSDITSITIYKTSVEDRRETLNEQETEGRTSKVINQSGQISGPVDSHHSTKLDTVRTSSSVLNGSGTMNTEFNHSTYNSGYRSYDPHSFSTTDHDKCSQQLDTLMKDLNIDNKSAFQGSRMNSNSYMLHTDHVNNNENSQNKIANRELQLMTELLEAQKEISNLRRSMNHLDLLEQSSTNRGFINKNSDNIFASASKFKGMTKGSISSSIPDAYNYSMSKSNNWSNNRLNTNSSVSPNIQRSSKFNAAPNNTFVSETRSNDDFLDNRQTRYSAHRENMDRDRMMKEKFMSSERMPHQNFHDDRESTDVFEEVETINLQPIGKGIQDLNKGNPQYRVPMGTTKIESASHMFNDNVESLSPLSTRKYLIQNKAEINSFSRGNSEISSPLMSYNGQQQNVTLQSIEEKMQFWYQPRISRDEAIAILKNCNPGNFLIRDSNTYSGAYGLAIKVAMIPQNVTVKSDDIESEKVRHYLIELNGNQGVSFKGFPEEPIFPSLSHLVLYYTRAASVLPCVLVLPDTPLDQTDMGKGFKTHVSSQSVIINSPKLTTIKKSDETGYSVYYLGCYDVEYITGPSVINKAIERLLGNIDARSFTECQMRINSGEGIVLTDLERKLFFRRHHPFPSISYCALDPKDRKIELEVCKSKGVKKTKIFGIIVKAYMAGENKCFLFGELDPSHKAYVIVKIINEQMQKSSEN